MLHVRPDYPAYKQHVHEEIARWEGSKARAPDFIRAFEEGAHYHPPYVHDPCAGDSDDDMLLTPPLSPSTTPNNAGFAHPAHG